MAQRRRNRRRTTRGRGWGRPSARGRRRSRRSSHMPPLMLLAAPVVVLALVLGFLAVRPRIWPDGDHSARVFIGVDRTRSFVRATGGDIEEDLASVFTLCAADGCHVAADGLTGDSRGTSALPISTKLQVPSGASTNDPAVRESLAEQLGAEWASRAASELGLDPSAGCSDLVSGLALARDALAGFESDGPRAIVLVTDAYSNCAPWDVVAAASEPGGTEALLARMREEGAIPDLTGITVRIVGGGRSTTPHPPLTEQIRTFWEQFLTEAGATLPPDWWRTRFDATSLTVEAVGQ